MSKLMLVLLVSLFCGYELGLAYQKDQTSTDEIQIGDMIFSRSQIEQREEVTPTGVSGFKWAKSNPWPGGVLPIKFNFEATDEQRSLFFESCIEWTKLANVRCILYSGQSHRLEINGNPKGGCNSTVGISDERKYGKMNLQPSDCFYKGVIVHELGHALGLIHEHERPDRDHYVKINSKNITTEYKFAFERIKDGRVLGPYDFFSIMHYVANAFSKNGLNTIEPRSGFGVTAADLGARMANGIPTELDGVALAAIYGQSTGVPIHKM